jgi:hypothetical protein
MKEIRNERNAGRKKKFNVPTKKKTILFPVECESSIIKAIEKITKPYSNGK